MSEAEELKVEAEQESCCVCGVAGVELCSPEEHDAAATAQLPPLRAMLLHLNNNKVVPSGRLCANCIRRTLDAYSFSTALASKGPPPLSEKIRALRKRLHELTQKIDVFIVVGGGGGADGAYSEQDIIMVERGALAACAQADLGDAARAPDTRGAPVYQCTVCPLTFTRLSSYQAHMGGHGAEAAHSCWECGERCATSDLLHQHQRNHAPPQHHALAHCYLCNTTFQNSSEERHHESGCPSTCPVTSCGRTLPSRNALRAHVSVHKEVCGSCFLVCGSAEERAAHALHHRRDKHFVCGYKGCILRFHTRSNLMAHIRKCHAAAGEGGGDAGSGEEGAPPAPPAPAPGTPCPHCARTFGSQAAMKRHARVHQTKNKNTQEMDWTEGEKVEYLEVETLEELE